MEGYITLPNQRTSSSFIYNDPFPDFCRAIYNGESQMLSVSTKRVWEIPGIILDAHNAYWRHQAYLQRKARNEIDPTLMIPIDQDEESRYQEMQCRFNMDRIGGIWSCVFFQNPNEQHPRRVVSSYTIVSTNSSYMLYKNAMIDKLDCDIGSDGILTNREMAERSIIPKSHFE